MCICLGRERDSKSTSRYSHKRHVDQFYRFFLGSLGKSKEASLGGDIEMVFRRSVYVLPWFILVLGYYNRDGKNIREDKKYWKGVQRDFGSVEFGAVNLVKNSVVLFGGEEGAESFYALPGFNCV